jgi:hypothetical protein
MQAILLAGFGALTAFFYAAPKLVELLMTLQKIINSVETIAGRKAESDKLTSALKVAHETGDTAQLVAFFANRKLPAPVVPDIPSV